MADKRTTDDFNLAAVKLPFETVLRFFAAYYFRSYAEMFCDDERAAGLGGAGVILEGHGITTATSFDYPHLRSWQTESPAHDAIYADMRLCALSGQPDWTILNEPCESNFHIGEGLKALSRAFDCTVYRFGSSEQLIDGKPATTAVFSASRGEGFLISPPFDRVVSTTWDVGVAKDGSEVIRHSFVEGGPPDPAEDCSLYGRSGPRNKMNRQVLLDIMSRLGLDIGAFPHSQDVHRCTLIGDMGEGTPIVPTRKEMALVDQVWPWRESETLVSRDADD